MTQKDRDLLLKDLSARLPYGVKVYDTKGNFNSNYQTLVHINGPVGEAFVVSGLMCRTAPITDLKPYLFPLSNITEEQRKNWFKESNVDYDCEFHIEPTISINFCHLSIDWLNKNHFDYRGLIERGLAIDCTNLNIY